MINNNNAVIPRRYAPRQPNGFSRRDESRPPGGVVAAAAAEANWPNWASGRVANHTGPTYTHGSQQRVFRRRRPLSAPPAIADYNIIPAA